MSRLNDQDLKVLQSYAKEGNRELYWNYLAQKEGADGYGLLALGVVRNDNIPGAVANAFAKAEAQRAGVSLTERDWNAFGIDLMKLDLERRQVQLENGRPDLALNLPVKDVMGAHDDAFRNAKIPVNAWTPREYLAAAHREGTREAPPGADARARNAAGDAEMQQAWRGMLDDVRAGIDRGAGTLWGTAVRYNDAQFNALDYSARLGAAYAAAGVSRSNQDPDRIGASNAYYQRRDDGRWFFVNEAINPMSLSGRMPTEVRDAETLRSLEDTRRLRLEIRDLRDDFHPLDPNGRKAPEERLRASPRTLADAEQPDAPTSTRLAATMDQPSHPDHALYRGGREAVERLEAGLGRAYDANSERLAQSATVLARQNGLERIDHVLLSIDNGRGVRAGESLFVVQGRADDPAHLRAMMRTDEAIARAPEKNEALLAEAREQQAQRTAAQQRELAQPEMREASARSVG